MIEQFISEIMQATGGAPEYDKVQPGKLGRFSTSDKRNDENGWYRLFEDQEGGVFGCWRQGISETWQARQPATPEQRAAFTEKVKQARQEAAKIEEQQRAECREWCIKTLSTAKDATSENPYLKRKACNAYAGVKSLRDAVVIPVQDLAGIVHGVQFIQPDGSKKFKTGTVKAGSFFKIGTSKNKTVVICEGYATGASIHQATGHAVVIAFDAGNLSPVAQGIRSKYPAMTIIIAADDDRATEGNPGLSKAIEAARVVGGLLARPVFPESRGVKDTDFNDLARLAGLLAVKACIDNAAIPEQGPNAETQPQTTAESPLNPIRAAVERLARLSPLEYDKVRKEEATALGVRPGTLDIEVKAMRKQAAANDTPFEEVEPWPGPVDGAALLDQINATVRRFIICSQETAQAVSLWLALTWFVDVVQVAPLAVITAPEKRCGKSMLLFLMGRMVPRPIMASSISPSALFRSIDAWKPTLLIDEVDACLKDNEELRGVLNAGHTRDSAFVIRCVGDDHKPQQFNVWGCKVLSGIGHVADTLMDRSIILELRRKLPHESVERIRHAEPGLFNELCSKLARFSEDNSEQVRLARPDLPHALNDRAQDNWEPLLAIAAAAGGNWLATATAAALKLSGSDSAAQSIGIELLADIREVFEQKHVDRISSADLIKELCSDDERPWATYNRGFQIKPRQIASKLKGYGIHSKTIRIGFGETPKGYELNQFREAFSRYIPSTPLVSATTPQTSKQAALPVADDTPRCGSVADKKQHNTLESKACCVVADREPFLASEVIDLTGIDFEVIG